MVSDQPIARSLQVADFGCIRSGRVLLRQINFQLQSGQILLLKGSNGTGKSTLLRSLAGLMTWRAGQLIWCGEAIPVRSPVFQQQLAYMGHHCAMSDALSGLENLRFFLNLQGVSWELPLVRPVLEQLGIAAVVHQQVGRMSQGQRRRLALARVMLSRRVLWLLDEPDNALDHDGSVLLAHVLEAHAAAGGMAVVVSHRGLNFHAIPTLTLDLNAHALQRCPQEAAC